jgi:hypothetical protein
MWPGRNRTVSCVLCGSPVTLPSKPALGQTARFGCPICHTTMVLDSDGKLVDESRVKRKAVPPPPPADATPTMPVSPSADPLTWGDTVETRAPLMPTTPGVVRAAQSERRDTAPADPVSDIPSATQELSIDDFEERTETQPDVFPSPSEPLPATAPQLPVAKGPTTLVGPWIYGLQAAWAAPRARLMLILAGAGLLFLVVVMIATMGGSPAPKALPPSEDVRPTPVASSPSPTEPATSATDVATDSLPAMDASPSEEGVADEIRTDDNNAEIKVKRPKGKHPKGKPKAKDAQSFFDSAISK